MRLSFQRAATAGALVFLVHGFGLAQRPVATPAAGAPALPSWSRQTEIRESWLPARHAIVLEAMRRHGIDMWIVVNEEFRDDPMTHQIAPPRPYTGRRDIFVFIDDGQRLHKRALTGFWEASVARHFDTPRDPRPARDVLPELYAEFKPKKIGLAIGGQRGVLSALSYDSYQFLREALGPEAEARFTSAAPVITEVFETRLPDEFRHYQALVHLTEWLARRALSREVITPGRTSVADVRRWLYDALATAGARTWFQPDLRVQRRGMPNTLSRGYLAIADPDLVIQRGDIVHLDFGVTAMGFDTDWQKNAYVLRDGETDAPAGLQRAMANTNALQDVLIRAARPGRTSGEVAAETMAEMQRRGITAEIYSHPLGPQGHGLGTGIVARPDTESVRQHRRLLGYLSDKPDPSVFKLGTYLAVELNTQTAVGEWNGQSVFVMMEDPAYLTAQGYEFFRPRQTAFYRIE